jgi:hypothetical protein
MSLRNTKQKLRTNMYTNWIWGKHVLSEKQTTFDSCYLLRKREYGTKYLVLRNLARIGINKWLQWPKSKQNTFSHIADWIYPVSKILFVNPLKSLPLYEGVTKRFRTESITKYTLTTINTRWEATQRVMAAKLTIQTHKIAIQLHLVAESFTIYSSHSTRQVRKLLDNPRNSDEYRSYIGVSAKDIIRILNYYLPNTGSPSMSFVK